MKSSNMCRGYVLRIVIVTTVFSILLMAGSAGSETNTGSISGFEINDTNRNGGWNAGEIGIPGWHNQLIGITGTGIDTRVIRQETSTDARGFYMFDNLPAGRYIIIERIQKGWIPTNSTVKIIKLTEGEISINNNFTNRLLFIQPRPANGAPGITAFSPHSPVSDDAGATRAFSITLNQTANVTWYINGTEVQLNKA